VREIWVIGNGFNKALAANVHFSALRGEVERISSLWDQFAAVLSSFKYFLRKSWVLH